MINPESCSTKAADAKVELVARAINNARYDYIADDYQPTEHELHVAQAVLTALEVADTRQDGGEGR